MGLPSRQSHVGMLWKCEFMDAQQSCEQPWWLIWKNHIRNKISINSKQKHLKCFQKKHLMFSKKHWTFLKKHWTFSKKQRYVFFGHLFIVTAYITSRSLPMNLANRTCCFYLHKRQQNSNEFRPLTFYQP